MSFFHLLPNEIKSKCIEFMDFYDRHNIAQCSKLERKLVSRLPTYVDEVYFSESKLQIKEGDSKITLIYKPFSTVVKIEVETATRKFSRTFPTKKYDYLMTKMINLLGSKTYVKTLKLEPSRILNSMLDKFFTMVNVNYKTVLISLNCEFWNGGEFEECFKKFEARHVELDSSGYFSSRCLKVKNILQVKAIYGLDCISEKNLMKFANAIKIDINPSFSNFTANGLIWFFKKWLRCKLKLEHKLTFTGKINNPSFRFDLEPFFNIFENMITKRSLNEFVFRKSKNEYAILKTGSEMYSFCSYFGATPVVTIEEEYENIEIEDYEPSDEDSDDGEIEEEDVMDQD